MIPAGFFETTEEDVHHDLRLAFGANGMRVAEIDMHSCMITFKGDDIVLAEGYDAILAKIDAAQRSMLALQNEVLHDRISTVVKQVLEEQIEKMEDNFLSGIEA